MKQAEELTVFLQFFLYIFSACQLKDTQGSGHISCRFKKLKTEIYFGVFAQIRSGWSGRLKVGSSVLLENEIGKKYMD